MSVEITIPSARIYAPRAAGGLVEATWTEPSTYSNGSPLTTLVRTWVEEQISGTWTLVSGSEKTASAATGGGAQSHTFTASVGATHWRVAAIDVPGNVVYSTAQAL